ncbi:MAG: 1,4-dihydroxy-2-naphthoate polyprenyltransferase [Polyangiaceae bacterium]
MTRDAALDAPLPRPGSLGVWLMAARPQTLPVAVAPVAVGASVAHAAGDVRVGAVLAALFGALMIQVGTNFANDVFDYEKGADTEERLGPRRAVQSGLLSPRAVRIGMIVSFGLATLAGAYLTMLAGPVIVAIGIVSILSGIAYTGGPYPLGYNGLGDLFVFVFFGLVAVCGTAFVALSSIPAAAWLAALPVGALATAVLVVNNARDYVTDARVGKRTLVVRFGRRFGTLEYAALVCIAYATPALMLGLGLAGPRVLIALLPLPLALRLCQRMSRSEGRELNPLLPATAKLLLLTSALLALGTW